MISLCLSEVLNYDTLSELSFTKKQSVDENKKVDFSTSPFSKFKISKNRFSISDHISNLSTVHKSMEYKIIWIPWNKISVKDFVFRSFFLFWIFCFPLRVRWHFDKNEP